MTVNLLQYYFKVHLDHNDYDAKNKHYIGEGEDRFAIIKYDVNNSIELKMRKIFMCQDARSGNIEVMTISGQHLFEIEWVDVLGYVEVTEIAPGLPSKIEPNPNSIVIGRIEELLAEFERRRY